MVDVAEDKAGKVGERGDGTVVTVGRRTYLG